jgi:hypothetical protein
MQRIRIFVAVVSLFGMLGVTGSAIAAPQRDNGSRVRDEQSQLQKQMAKLKGRLAKTLDDLENKMSIPPA